MAEPNSAVGAAQIHEAVRAAFGLSAEAYTLTQLRYDLRKLKAMACYNEKAELTVTGSPKRERKSPL